MTRRKLADILKNGQRRRDVGEGEIGAECIHVDSAGEVLRPQDRFHFRSKIESSVVAGDKQRLDSQAVASEKKGFGLLVPDGKGEHAAESVHACRSPGGMGVQDDFGVGAGDEMIAERDEFLADLLVIEDFPVVDDAAAAVFGKNRLSAGMQIDDAEPAMAEKDLGGREVTAVIRPAMTQRIGAGDPFALIHRPVIIQIQDAEDTAHKRP